MLAFWLLGCTKCPKFQKIDFYQDFLMYHIHDRRFTSNLLHTPFKCKHTHTLNLFCIYPLKTLLWKLCEFIHIKQGLHFTLLISFLTLGSGGHYEGSRMVTLDRNSNFAAYIGYAYWGIHFELNWLNGWEGFSQTILWVTDISNIKICTTSVFHQNGYKKDIYQY